MPVTAAILEQSDIVPESPVVITGAIVSVNRNIVRLKTKEGVVAVHMKPGWTVVSSHPANATDIKPGDFIASNNLNVDPTSGTATELRIFEPSYRPEYGSHAMPTHGYTMTHALVASSTPSQEGQRLVVTYPAGTRNILVPPTIKVIGYTIEDHRLAKPGTIVTAVTRKDPDGVARAGRVVLANQ